MQVYSLLLECTFWVFDGRHDCFKALAIEVKIFRRKIFVLQNNSHQWGCGRSTCRSQVEMVFNFWFYIFYLQVPDHLQCKITMDIFRDPVITPSGVTYERAILLEHLRKVTHLYWLVYKFISMGLWEKLPISAKKACLLSTHSRLYCDSIWHTKLFGKVQVGKFDPLTRAPLQPEQVVPNLAIKEAVRCYLLEHGWAYRTF